MAKTRDGKRPHRCNRVVRCDGVRYAEGAELWLTEAQARPIVERGAVTPMAGGGADESGGEMSVEADAEIVAAIGKLKPEDFNRDGSPSADALNKAMGRKVDAEARAAAFAAFEKEKKT